MDELARTFLQPHSEAWAIYADELQARGDLRGELIAIELGLDGELSAQERDRLEAAAAPLREQFAASLARRLEHAGIQAGVAAAWRFGFLRSVKVERSFELRECLASVLVGDDARFLCGLDVEVFPNQLESFVEQLGATPRTLRWVSICSYDDNKPSIPVGAAQVDRLARALPCLRALTLIGRRMLERLEHPSLESLRIRGHDAIVEIDRVELPRLVELEYTLMAGSLLEQIARAVPELDRFASALDGPAMPALRRLDLSRNNPGVHEHSCFLGGADPGVLLEVVALTSVASRVEDLLLPTIKQAQLVDALDQLARVPRLHMPTLYNWISDLSAARLRELLPNLEIGAEYPHQPAQEIHGREVLSIQTNPCSEDNFVWVGFKRLAGMLENRWEALSATSRARFDELIDSFDELAYSDSGDDPRELLVPMAPLRSAVHELVCGADSVDARVRELVRLLERHVDCCETIRLAKVWGW